MKIILLILCLLFITTNAFAANRFWVGGTATWDATAGTKWSTTTGGAGGSAVPTASDDCFFDAASGAVTVTTSGTTVDVCRSIDFTGFTGTISHAAATTILIGTTTPGPSNVALKLVAGMTYTLGDAVTSAITFQSTSATQQTVDFGSKTMGSLTFGTSGTPNYAMISNLTTGATASITSTFGNLHFDGTSDNSGLTHSFGFFVASALNTRTIFLGNSNITVSWNSGTKTIWTVSGGAGVMLTSGSSNITIPGNATGGTTLTFSPGASANTQYGNISIAGPNEISISGNFVNFTRNGTSDLTGRNTLQVNINGTLKVTGVFTITGESAVKRALVWPSSNGIAVPLDLTGATMALQNVNFQDITFTTAGTNLDFSAVTGGSGDFGGNTITGGGTLTFTPATTQVWQTTGAGNVSDVTKWTSRVPLPQDNVVFSSAFTGSPIIVDDEFIIGNIDFSTSTGTVTFQASINGTYINGNVKLRTGVTLTNAVSCSFYLNSRVSTTTFTFGGGTQSAIVQSSSSNGGNITIADSGNWGAALQQRSGTITIPLGITFGVDSYLSNATSASAISIINILGTWNLRSSNGSIFVMTNSATLTSVIGSGTIGLTSAGASNHTFAGGGNTYPQLNITGGGAGSVIISGSNTFPSLPKIVGGTKTLTFTAGTTQTYTNNGDDSFGNGSNIITINSSSGGSAATLSKASGIVRGNFLSLQDSTATGGAAWFAGLNSTNVSGNTGWIFGTTPVRASINNAKLTNFKSGY